MVSRTVVSSMGPQPEYKRRAAVWAALDVILRPQARPVGGGRAQEDKAFVDACEKVISVENQAWLRQWSKSTAT